MSILIKIITLFSISVTTMAVNNNDITLRWENDAPFESDKYYTNGFRMLYKRRFYTSESVVKLRLGIAHKIYTPEATVESAVVPDDHPYTGLLYGILGFSFANSNFFLSADLWAGKQGPDAKADIIQNWFHSKTPSSPVNGWENQTANQSFLNGDIKLLIINRGQFFELSPWTRARFGQLIDDVEAGFKLGMRLGFLELFSNATATYTFYNSILQGPKSGESVYVIEKEDIERIFYKADVGLNLNFSSFRMTLKATRQSPQFKTSQYHTYGTFETAFFF